MVSTYIEYKYFFKIKCFQLEVTNGGGGFVMKIANKAKRKIEKMFNDLRILPRLDMNGIFLLQFV